MNSPENGLSLNGDQCKTLIAQHQEDHGSKFDKLRRRQLGMYAPMWVTSQIGCSQMYYKEESLTM